MRKIILLFSLVLLTASLQANEAGSVTSTEQLCPDYNDKKAHALSASVDYLESLLWTRYAPIRWKMRHWHWDPSQEGAYARERLAQLEQLDLESIKPALNRMIYSTRDIHTAIVYADRQVAYLPFTAQWIEGKALITQNDLRTELRVGDEIIAVDGEPLVRYMNRVLLGLESDALTSRPAFLIDRLFSRRGARDQLPIATDVVLTVRNDSGDHDVELEWSFINQKKVSKSSTAKEASLATDPRVAKIQSLMRQAMLYQIPDELLSAATQESSGELEISIRNINGAKIAYFCLPNFADQDAITLFDANINKLNKTSDALLIDLRGNPGGYLLMAQALLSRISSKPLINLTDSMLLSEEKATNGAYIAETFEEILQLTTTDKELQEILGEVFMGVELTREFFKELMLFFRSQSEEWEAGYTCSRFVPMYGRSLITPHSKCHYNKAVFLLIDEKCASCADIVPAVAKDNECAILLGRTTTGAGGCVETYSFPNFLGIKAVYLTQSLMLRSNQMVIEDLGIAPHFEYNKSLEDCLNPNLELERAFQFAAYRVGDNVMRAK